MASSKQINSKIVGFKVRSKDEPEAPPEAEPIVSMHESVKRPEVLVGSTYKVKAPVIDHAMYITVNDIILNPDTAYESRQPFEVFINSKNMENFQWVVALTRLISAVFRKGGDTTFMLEELKAVFDPKGGYFQKGVYVPSIVAEIGGVLEKHMLSTGSHTRETDSNQQEYLASKREELELSEGEFPSNATVCPKCSAKAVILMDGCQTCLNCADSKCG